MLLETKEYANKLEITQGWIIALRNIDGVLNTIKSSKSEEKACKKIMEEYSLNENQAISVINASLMEVDDRRIAELEKQEKDLILILKEKNKIIDNSLLYKNFLEKEKVI